MLPSALELCFMTAAQVMGPIPETPEAQLSSSMQLVLSQKSQNAEPHLPFRPTMCSSSLFLPCLWDFFLGNPRLHSLEKAQRWVDTEAWMRK